MTTQSAETELVEDKLDFKRLLPIIFIVFVDSMGLTMIFPLLPYYVLSFDAGPAVIGLLSASYPLMQFFGGPLLSALSDRYGRRPVLAFAQAGTFLSLLLLGAANALWIIFLARILDGLTGANLATVQAAVADVTTPKNRNQGLGLVGAAFGLGFVFGPALSGLALILSGAEYSAPAIMAAAFAFVSVLLTTFFFEETLPPHKRGEFSGERVNWAADRLLKGLRNPTLNILFILLFLYQLVFAAFRIMFAPFTLNRLGLNSVGNTIFFVVIGVLVVIMQGGLIGPLTKRVGERGLVLSGLVALAVGLLLMSQTPQQVVPWYTRDAIIAELSQQNESASSETTTSLSDEATLSQIKLLPPMGNAGYWGITIQMIAVVPIVFGASMLQPSLNSLITQSSAETDVGATLGVSSAFLSLATIIGPFWGGIVFELIGPAAPFWIGGIVSALVVPLAARRITARDPDDSFSHQSTPG